MRIRRSLVTAPTGDMERGQVLVIFALSMVVAIAMVGLVIDGGSAFAQRRDQQNVADLAAMAGATAYLNTAGGVPVKMAAAEYAATMLAAVNGFVAGTDGVTVDVAVIGATTDRATIRIDVGKAHRNHFVGIIGMPTWGIGVTASATSSQHPNGASGAMPLLFNEAAFPNAVCDLTDPQPCVPEVYQLPGTGNEDVPQDATQFNWTIFCTAHGNPCNGDSDGVSDLIHHRGTDTVIDLNDDIGPLNAGTHADLFNDLNRWIDFTFPVPIVNDAGEMIGWAYFHLTDIQGAPEKVILGYFESPVNASQLVVVNDGGNPTLDTGSFVIKLID